MKKLHWTQTPKGRRIMAQRKKKGTSRAETVLNKETQKNKNAAREAKVARIARYKVVARESVLHGDYEDLMHMIAAEFDRKASTMRKVLGGD